MSGCTVEWVLRSVLLLLYKQRYLVQLMYVCRMKHFIRVVKIVEILCILYK